MAASATHPRTINDVRHADASVTGSAGLLFVAGAALLLGAAGMCFVSEDMPRFWFSYLLSSFYFLTIAIGGLFFVVVQHLAGARWSVVVRRLAEFVAGNMALMAVLFLPIAALVLMGDSNLYNWNDPEVVAGDRVLESKSSWLSPGWFTFRLALYFLTWAVMAGVFVRTSIAQDRTGDPGPLRWLSRISGPTIFLFAFTVNFAAFDIAMSLSPHWFSSMFGVCIFAGSFEGFLALLMLLIGRAQSRGMLCDSITVEHRHDIAKLMFAFVVFWSYVNFSQYMLIWYANIPEETEWFAVRQTNAWLPVGLLLIFGHLIIPFLGFMSRAVRRSRSAMTFWACWMLAIHWVDLFYIIMPNYSTETLPLGLTELLTLAGIGALFLASILYQARGKWLLPVGDPRLPESLAFINH